MRAILLGILAASLVVAKPVRLVSLDPSDPAHDVPLPTRPLEWGDVNVLHTTDIHGWISGHQKDVYPEKSWSGRFGDLFSFVSRMRRIADQRGSDLLLVDTGDRRIGHGLTDHILDPLEGVNGQNASMLYYGIGYDLVVPGNHDLQNAHVVKWTKETLVNYWKDRYLTSNINRTDEEDPENRKPLGARYRRWKTRKGKRMLAFGVVTSKTRLPKDANLEIVPINEMIEQKWFQDAIKPDSENPVDVFVILGHVDPRKPTKEDDIGSIYEAIRREHPLTPIMIFAGHTHQRWCKTYQTNDATRSMLLQSGRYFDTVGWMSVQLDDNTVSRDLKFSRRYLDNNVPTFMYHTGIGDEEDFHTGWGRSINKVVRQMEDLEALSRVYGHLESDYYLDRQWWTEKEEDKHSLFSFYLDAVQNSLVDSKRSPNWLFFSNWGIVRGDIYRGPFMLSDLYSISPDASDTSPFLYTTVPRRIADRVVEVTRRVDKAKGDLSHIPKPQPEVLQVEKDNSQTYFSLSEKSSGTTYGWVTTDECGNDGDDVKHIQVPQVDFSKEKSGLPVYFWRKSYGNELGPEDPVDIIVTNYVGGRWVPKALEHLGMNNVLKLRAYREDVRQNNLLTTYIQAKFP